MGSVRRLTAVVAGLAVVVAACGADDESAEETDEDAVEAEDEGLDEEDEAAEEDVDEAEADDSDALSDLEGELVTIVVGTSPGGGFDAYARLFAPYLAEELDADVTVENLTGAGGLLAVNNVWEEEPDGTTLLMMNGSGVTGSVLSDAEGIEFEVEEFSYIGRLASLTTVITVHSGLPYEDPEDLFGLDEFRFATTGPGGGTHQNGTLYCEVFNITDCELVSGFDGAAEAQLAVSVGEVDSIATTYDSLAGDIEEGDQRAVVVNAPERLEDLPDTPTFAELDLDEQERDIAEAAQNMGAAGRIVVAPPGMDADLLEGFRQAFDSVAENEDFVAEAEEQGRPIEAMTGDEVEGVVSDAVSAPDHVRELLQEAAE